MKKMVISKITVALTLLATLIYQPSTVFAQGTAFTYQGRLNDGANPASGSYDLRFAIFDDPTGGLRQGSRLTNSATAVSNGLFTVTLDFGNQFPGANRWLEIAVRTNGGGAFINLAPRQPFTATPYAITADSATSLLGTLPAAQLSGSLPVSQVSGTLPLEQLPAGVLTNEADGLNLAGVFGRPPAWGAFVLASSPAAGNVPVAVTAADVNGDGKPDLISTYIQALNNGAGTLRVMTNDGGGGFVLASTNAVGSNPNAVVAADVNGDGGMDLICMNTGEGTLSVLTNNGSGGFLLASSPAVGNTPRGLAATDVNGDGKVDVIAANLYGIGLAYGTALAVLTNDGTGGFVLASSPTVGSGPIAVTAADVNGNGKMDLISVNFNANTLTVLTNNGSGGFALASSPAVGFQPRSVVAADVNEDGSLDLVCTGDDTLARVLTNAGAGNFVLTSSPAAGSAPVQVVAADVNADGRVDLITVNQGDNTLTVLTNSGSGGFALASSPAVGTQPRALVAADVNGDGMVDLISANQNDGTLTVLFNTQGLSTFIGDGSGLSNVKGSTAANYVFGYATNTQTVAVSGTFQDVTIGVDAVINGWTHTPGTATYTNAQTGLYLIQYDGQAQFTGGGSTAAMRALLNGSPIPGSQAGISIGAGGSGVLGAPISKSFIASIAAGSTLKLQFTGTGVPAAQLVGGGASPTNSVSMTIIRIQ